MKFILGLTGLAVASATVCTPDEIQDLRDAYDPVLDATDVSDYNSAAEFVQAMRDATNDPEFPCSSCFFAYMESMYRELTSDTGACQGESPACNAAVAAHDATFEACAAGRSFAAGVSTFSAIAAAGVALFAASNL